AVSSGSAANNSRGSRLSNTSGVPEVVGMVASPSSTALSNRRAVRRLTSDLRNTSHDIDIFPLPSIKQIASTPALARNGNLNGMVNFGGVLEAPQFKYCTNN